MVKDKLIISEISNVRLEKKLEAIKTKVTKIENNFLQKQKAKEE